MYGETSVFLDLLWESGKGWVPCSGDGEVNQGPSPWWADVSVRLEMAVSSTSGSSLINSVMAACEQQRL